MGVITDYFLADSLDDAASIAEAGRHRVTRWEERYGAPDPTVGLPLLASAVLGVPEADLDPAATQSDHAPVGDEAFVLSLPPPLTSALAGLDEARLEAVADDFDESTVSMGGETVDVLRDLSAFASRAVAESKQIFVFLSP